MAPCGETEKTRRLRRVFTSESIFDFFDDIAHFDIESRTDPIERFKRRLALAAFDCTQVRASDIGKPTEYLLRQPFFFAKICDHITDCYRVECRNKQMNHLYYTV